jgi:hypothetical protein
MSAVDIPWLPGIPGHRVTLADSRRRDGQVWHRVICSCGGYRSAFCYYPGLAEMAGLDHVKAKEGAR